MVQLNHQRLKVFLLELGRDIYLNLCSLFGTTPRPEYSFDFDAKFKDEPKHL